MRDVSSKGQRVWRGPGAGLQRAGSGGTLRAPLAHVARGAAEGSGVPLCLRRGARERLGVWRRLPSLDLLSRDRGARLGRRRLEEPPSGDTCVPVRRPYCHPQEPGARERDRGPAWSEQSPKASAFLALG